MADDPAGKRQKGKTAGKAMEKEIRYRKGTLKDLDSICEMIQKAIAEMNSKAIYQWDEKYPARSDFVKDIEQGQLTVGMVNGKPACIYVLSKECDAEYESANWTDQNGNYYVIHRLCVNPEIQNQGIAGKMMEKIEKDVKAAGGTSVRLDAFSQNPYALRLYEHAGYCITGSADWRMGQFVLMEKML